MENNIYNSYMEVDLKKLKANFERVRAHIGPNINIIPILKGNAYGLGGIELAKFYVDEFNVNMIGNSQVQESVEMREAGINCELLVLGDVPFNNIPAAVQYSIQTAAFEREYIDLLDEEAARQRKTAEIQIKINTGMNRVGVHPGEKLINFVRYLKTKNNIKVRGAFTHYASSHAADHSFAIQQFKLFKQGIEEIKREGIGLDYIHSCNGCATVWFPEAYCNAVRPGNLLLGYDYNKTPSNSLGIESAVTWRCFVTQIKTLQPGDTLGYDQYFTAIEPTKVATISIGHGDGYYRPMLMEGGHALINGKKCKFLGASMDQSYLAIDGVPDVVLNNEVTLLGKDGDCEITPFDWRDFTGQSFVFLNSMRNIRVKRIYVK